MTVVIIDRIPPLPHAITDTEELVCPWCRRAASWNRHPVDEDGCEHVDRYLCECGRDFEVVPCVDSDVLVARGLRSETDRRFMEAMCIDEGQVIAHHIGAVED